MACLSAEGKSLKDEDVLQKLPVGTTATLYFRDLGAQISWVTVSPEPYLRLPLPLTTWGDSPKPTFPGLPDRVCGTPFHLPALLLPGSLHLWPQIRLHVQPAHSGAVCGPGWKGDGGWGQGLGADPSEPAPLLPALPASATHSTTSSACWRRFLYTASPTALCPCATSSR